MAFPLLEVSKVLLTRQPGQPGALPTAGIRRSISTTYYALFHFLLEAACSDLLGADPQLSTRRRLFARKFDHKGLKSAFQLMRGNKVDDAVVADFMRYPAFAPDPVAVPRFARRMAGVFLEAQSERHTADYNFAETFTEREARSLIDEAEETMNEWWGAHTKSDQRFKSGLYALMLVGGRLRSV